MSTRHAFTFPELVAVIAVLAVAAAIALILLPARSHHGGRRQMPNNTQLRGIHQSMVMYAQSNKGMVRMPGGHYRPRQAGFFPGIDEHGDDVDLAVESRFHVLLDQNYFTGDYLVNPAEMLTAWTTGTLTSAQYSYALLQVPDAGGRREEWSETLNTEAPVASDRNLGAANAPYSVWTGQNQGWHGSVVWNDNHTQFESTHVLRTRFPTSGHVTTSPGVHSPVYRNDHLFDSSGNDDALMIHSGNDP